MILYLRVNWNLCLSIAPSLVPFSDLTPIWTLEIATTIILALMERIWAHKSAVEDFDVTPHWALELYHSISKPQQQTSIHKQGSKHDCTSYRPMSLSDDTSKIKQRFICEIVHIRLTRNNQLNHAQQWFVL